MEPSLYYGDVVMLRMNTGVVPKLSPLKPTGFIPAALKKENNKNTLSTGVEIEGFPKGGKRRGRENLVKHQAHRVPRDIRQSGNRFDISAGRRGMFRCPYLGIYCSGKSAVDVRKCKGFDECHIRLTNKLIDRTWQRIRNENN